MTPQARDIRRVIETAECLVTAPQIANVLDELASAVRADFATLDPVIVCVMSGGIVTMGHLLTRLDFPLQVDYVHATRYRGDMVGRELTWLHKPETRLNGRHVLLVDDILDEGVTLRQVSDYCQIQGAASVKTLVLVDKLLSVDKPIVADYVGQVIPNRYVFGFGMDYKSYGRNLPAIYAVKEGAAT